MFRSAAVIDAERTGTKVREILASWEDSTDSWFDGSVDSVDRRLGSCNKLIGYARAASVRLLDRPEGVQYVKLAHELQADQQALTQLRHDLLYAASDREAWKTKEERDSEKRERDDYRRKRDLKVRKGLERTYGPKAARWIELEAQKFLADNQDALDDMHELQTRAANHAELHTSALSPKASREITAAFVERVAAGGQPVNPNLPTVNNPPTNQVPTGAKSGPGLIGQSPKIVTPGNEMPGGPGPGGPAGQGPAQDPVSQMGYRTSHYRQAAGGQVVLNSPSGTAGVPGIPKPNFVSPGLAGGPLGVAPGAPPIRVQPGQSPIGGPGPHPQQSQQQQEVPAGQEPPVVAGNLPGIQQGGSGMEPRLTINSPINQNASRHKRFAAVNQDFSDELMYLE